MANVSFILDCISLSCSLKVCSICFNVIKQCSQAAFVFS